jgi:Na+/proline symporter
VLVFQGGLKAVVWSDTLQQVIMMASSVVVVVLGILAVGGLDVMWQRNVDGHRIEFFKYVTDFVFSIPVQGHWG